MKSSSLRKRMTVNFSILILILSISCVYSTPFFPNNSVPSNDPLPGGTSDVEKGQGKQTVLTPKLLDEYLSNPGIGWQHDLDKAGSNHLPETVAYGNRLNLTWSDLNPSDGLYKWEPLDMQLASAIAEGKQFSFRVLTMIGEIYGGHRVPDWVIEKGAVVMPSGEPDYANCTFQGEWGNFVDALIDRYDGNKNISFVDISGYGNFNEWNWIEQTEWDYLWDQMYASDNARPFTMETLDSQARRRLADMFIGGSLDNHQCRDQGNKIQTVSYSYGGFQQTQLIMPYAGIVQSIQYVFSQRDDIGFRYDCLGRENDVLTNNLFSNWQNAPVIYELCSPAEFDFTIAQQDLYETHGSLVHNNSYELDAQSLRHLMLGVGYRYYLEEARFTDSMREDDELSISMVWQNVGTAPSYPKMGQDFQLHVYLLDAQGSSIKADFPVESDISAWMPADPLGSTPPGYQVDVLARLPNTLQPGNYLLKVAIIDNRTGSPIQLAIDGADQFGLYILSDIEIVSGE
jgi:hypothetical protein